MAKTSMGFKCWCFGLLLVACWMGCGGPSQPPGQEGIVILQDERSGSRESSVQEPTTPRDGAAEPSAEPVAQPEPQTEPLDPFEPMTESQPDAGGSDVAVPEPAMDASGPEPEPTLPEPQPEPSAPDRVLLQSWIGESCATDADCDYADGYCLKSGEGYPGGHCTKDCTSTCPDRTGKPVTFCVEASPGKGRCVSQCSQSACRADYVCQVRQRYNQSSVVKQVCVPKPPPGQGRTFLYIGDSQSSGTRFASTMVSFLRSPRVSCPGAKTTANTVYSYAKVSSAARHWSELSGSSKNWLCGASTVYTNGTAASNTNGSALCSGITNISKSIFQKRIEVHKPDAFLIQLGGNSVGFSESYAKSRIQRMLDQMPAGSLCFWVPPSYGTKNLTGRRNMETWIKETLQNYTRISCSVHTSITEMSQQTKCSSFNSGDGVHMTSCGSQLWGELIRQKMCATGKL